MSHCLSCSATGFADSACPACGSVRWEPEVSERFPDEVLQRVYQAAAIAASEAHAEFATPEDITARAIAAMRAVLEGHLAEERVRTLCPECGPNVKIDEDGCCTACGCDVAEVPPGAASDGRKHDPDL